MAKAPSFRLAVDIGNTQTVAGLFQENKIQRRWRIATRKDTTADEIAFWLRGLTFPNAHGAGVELGRISEVALASVVPSQDAHWLAALREAFEVKPQVLDYQNCLGLKLKYEIPRQIGADRLANVLGAESLGVEEGIVIDFGTATTFDVFSKRTYFGGVICPGIQSSMRILAQSAAKLSESELQWPKHAIGRNTEDAMRIGILRGTVGMVEKLLADILKEAGFDRGSTVLATGGLAVWMQGRTKAIKRIEPDLTLMGINHLLDGRTVKRKRT